MESEPRGLELLAGSHRNGGILVFRRPILLFRNVGFLGLWHDEIHLEDIQEMPSRCRRIRVFANASWRVVKELQNIDLEPQGLARGGVAAHQRLPALEQELDAVVFDLYQFNAAERDLVREMCTIGLDLFYRKHR